jgi:hypothetical protein
VLVQRAGSTRDLTTPVEFRRNCAKKVIGSLWPLAPQKGQWLGPGEEIPIALPGPPIYSGHGGEGG